MCFYIDAAPRETQPEKMRHDGLEQARLETASAGKSQSLSIGATQGMGHFRISLAEVIRIGLR